MPIESVDYRISPENYRAGLEMAYRAAPGRVGAAAMLGLMQALFDTMVELHNEVTTSPFNMEGDFTGVLDFGRYKRTEMARAFRGWEKRTQRLGYRLQMYWAEIREPDLTPDDKVVPGYIKDMVADPVLRGKWHEDAGYATFGPAAKYMGEDWPKTADAIELARLWNMVASVKGLVDTMGWDSLEAMLAELAMYAVTQMNKHMPGEPKTWRDEVDDIIDDITKHFHNLWKWTEASASPILLGAAAILGGYVGWKLLTRK